MATFRSEHLTIDAVDFNPPFTVDDDTVAKIMSRAVKRCSDLLHIRGFSRFPDHWRGHLHFKDLWIDLGDIDVPVAMAVGGGDRRQLEEALSDHLTREIYAAIRRHCPGLHAILQGKAVEPEEVIRERALQLGYADPDQAALDALWAARSRPPAPIPPDAPPVPLPDWRFYARARAAMPGFQRAAEQVRSEISVVVGAVPDPAVQHRDLEQRAIALMTSQSAEERLAGKLLSDHLYAVRRVWARKAVEGLYARFKGAPGGPSWKLGDRIAWQPKEGGEQDFASNAPSGVQRRALANISKAWTRIRDVCHPALLAGIPEPKVVVHEDSPAVARAFGFGFRAFHRGDEIHISHVDAPRTIMHEFGHHVETFGGLRRFAAVQAYMARHTRGDSLSQLRYKEFLATYDPDEMTREGVFLDPYISKYYEGGFTEVVSMALERMAKPHLAEELYLEDPDLFMTVLSILQDPGYLGT